MKARIFWAATATGARRLPLESGKRQRYSTLDRAAGLVGRIRVSHIPRSAVAAKVRIRTGYEVLVRIGERSRSHADVGQNDDQPAGRGLGIGRVSVVAPAVRADRRRHQPDIVCLQPHDAHARFSGPGGSEPDVFLAGVDRGAYGCSRIAFRWELWPLRASLWLDCSYPKSPRRRCCRWRCCWSWCAC